MSCTCLGEHHDATVLKWRQLLKCPVEVEELGEVIGDGNMETESETSSQKMSTEPPTESSSGNFSSDSICESLFIHVCPV